MMQAPDLAGLIAEHKADRSYEALSVACGGTPTAERLQQMVTKPIHSFPGPPTIEALARGLEVTVTEVVAASARSLGLDVRDGHDATSLLLAQAGQLPSGAKAALRSVAREMLSLHGIDTRQEVGGRDAASDTAPIGKKDPGRRVARTVTRRRAEQHDR